MLNLILLRLLVIALNSSRLSTCHRSAVVSEYNAMSAAATWRSRPQTKEVTTTATGKKADLCFACASRRNESPMYRIRREQTVRVNCDSLGWTRPRTKPPGTRTEFFAGLEIKNKIEITAAWLNVVVLRDFSSLLFEGAFVQNNYSKKLCYKNKKTPSHSTSSALGATLTSSF